MDQSALATPHGLSQRATSFIASRCQGIHQMLLRRLTRPQHPAQGQNPKAETIPTGQDRVRLLKTGAQLTLENAKPAPARSQKPGKDPPPARARRPAKLL